MKTFYTYLWFREDGTPYYVGKGHGDRAFSTNTHRFRCPPRERIKVQEWSDEETAFAIERYLIDFYGRKDLGTGCLRNLTDGGENPPKSSFKGLTHTKEAKEKMRLSHIKTHCKRGHEFSGSNLRLWRGLKICAECRNIRQRLRRQNEETSTHRGRDRTGRFLSVRVATGKRLRGSCNTSPF